MKDVVTEDGAGRRRKEKRVASVGVGAIAAVVLLAVALVFTNAFGARQVAQNARALHWANASLGAAAIARAANAQALVFAVDEQLGTADSTHADAARAEASAALRTLGDWLAAGVGQDTGGELDALATTGRRVLALIDQGDLVGAADLNAGEFEDAYAAARALLEAEQERATARITSSEDAAGRIAAITRLLVTLAIPIGALAVYRSIARRQVRRDREQAAALLRAERELHQAKDEFIASISHEIRTPLTSIYGFSEVLVESGLVDPDGAMELISLINTESSELSRMVEDLLTAARIDAGALTFHPSALAAYEEVEAVVAPLRRAGAAVDIDCATGELWADRVRFHQVIRNLVSNAVKHGGPTVRVTGGQIGDRYVCTVSDDGDGVAPEVRGRLFERFVHSGHESLLVGSVGLGLAIARSLVESMDASLHYERDGAWTHFVVDFPARQPLATGAAREPAGAVTA